MDVHTSPTVLVLPDATHQASFTISRYNSLATNTTTAISGHYEAKGRIADEKALPWDGYQEDQLPDKLHGSFMRNARFQVFSLYRRLFGVVFTVNMGVFIAACVSGTTAQTLGQTAVANIFVAVLIRQDYVVNALFSMACAAPRSWPLCVRRVLARIYSIGGIHSGCAVSGTVWLILFTAQATRQFVQNDKITAPTVAVGYVILALLIVMIVFAHPKMRARYHDTFEMTHRFAGWTAVALVWCLVILLVDDYTLPDQTLTHAVIRAPSFWLLLITTISIALPWLRLRNVAVRAEPLSDHCVRLHFDYATTQPGHFTRLSLSPLIEWHSFAAVAVPGTPGHSVIVSRVGDWTAACIANPPTRLWVRGAPCYGVVRVATMFRRVLLVATGSGIAPIAPVVFARRVPALLLWTAPAVHETFGHALVDSLRAACPGAVIYDTREHGRPDMVRLAYRMVRRFEAEAVVVISNEPLTRKVVYGLMSRGVPAFGAIWDS